MEFIIMCCHVVRIARLLTTIFLFALKCKILKTEIAMQFITILQTWSCAQETYIMLQRKINKKQLTCKNWVNSEYVRCFFLLCPKCNRMNSQSQLKGMWWWIMVCPNISFTFSLKRIKMLENKMSALFYFLLTENEITFQELFRVFFLNI